MSKISLTPNASGTANFTIASPATNTDRTLTLPDATGTINTSGAVNEVPAGTASAPSIYPTGDTNTGIFFPAADTIGFTEGGAEAMRIDSSGNVLVGTTAQINVEKFGVVQSGNGQVGYLHSTDSSTFTSNVLLLRGNRNTTNATWSFLRCYNNADKLFIYDSGNVVNTNNSYGAISDIKLKENIVDATPKLDKLNQVRVVNYNLIGEKHKQLGVIAQELEQIFPSMIDESPDLDKEGNELGTTTKSVKYSVFIPMLIKAIQEQQTIIETLKADIAELKAKVNV